MFFCKQRRKTSQKKKRGENAKGREKRGRKRGEKMKIKGVAEEQENSPDITTYALLLELQPRLLARKRGGVHPIFNQASGGLTLSSS